MEIHPVVASSPSRVVRYVAMEASIRFDDALRQIRRRAPVPECMQTQDDATTLNLVVTCELRSCMPAGGQRGRGDSKIIRCANKTYTRALREGGEGVSSPRAKVRVDYARLNVVRAHSVVRLQLQG